MSVLYLSTAIRALLSWEDKMQDEVDVHDSFLYLDGRKRGHMTSVIVASILISTWREGPAVSLNGSPTVSPVTAETRNQKHLWTSKYEQI